MADGREELREHARGEGPVTAGAVGLTGWGAFRLEQDGRVVVLEILTLVEEEDGLHMYWDPPSDEPSHAILDVLAEWQRGSARENPSQGYSGSKDMERTLRR